MKSPLKVIHAWSPEDIGRVTRCDLLVLGRRLSVTMNENRVDCPNCLLTKDEGRYEPRIAEAKLAPAWLIVVCIVGIILAATML